MPGPEVLSGEGGEHPTVHRRLHRRRVAAARARDLEGRAGRDRAAAGHLDADLQRGLGGVGVRRDGEAGGQRDREGGGAVAA